MYHFTGTLGCVNICEREFEFIKEMEIEGGKLLL